MQIPIATSLIFPKLPYQLHVFFLDSSLSPINSA